MEYDAMRRSFQFPIFLFSLVGVFALFLFLSIGVKAMERNWSISGTGDKISVADCADCDEDIGILLSCLGAGKGVELTVPSVAVEKVVEGSATMVKFIIDGRAIAYSGVVELQGLIGYLPRILIGFDDPIIEALAAGQQLVVKFANTEAKISLSGSRPALTQLSSQCRAWTPK